MNKCAVGETGAWLNLNGLVGLENFIGAVPLESKNRKVAGRSSGVASQAQAQEVKSEALVGLQVVQTNLGDRTS